MKPPLTRRAVLSQAWPIVLSQATVPTVGLVDTAVIGRTGDGTELAAVALGAALMNFVFWTFGFLRMGVTGMTSQADGAGERGEVQALLVRSVGLGAVLGVLLALLQVWILTAGFALLSASAEVEGIAGGYARARFFGAPAALAVYALNGWLLGTGRTRHALALQIVMNLANIGFDLAFVAWWGMGASGVGYGTAAAEWCALAFGLLLCVRCVRHEGGWVPDVFHAASLLAPERVRRMLVVNGDIMLRTIALLTLFTWFTNSGARQGDTVLAANHVLMQMISIAAFVLDAFAFTAEARVGAAFGARSKEGFWRAVRLTGEFALGGGVLLCLSMILAGGPFIAALTTDPAVREEALRFLPLASLVAVLGAPSWMLDGVFVGATRSREMRIAALVALALYIGLDLSLRPLGNQGVWLAITASYVIRAGALGVYLPRLVAAFEQEVRTESAAGEKDELG